MAGWTLPLGLTAVIVAACVRGEGLEATEAEEVPSPTPAAGAAPARPGYEVVAAGLEVPWDLGFATDGRLFVTERPGRIRVVENGRLRPEPWAELDVVAEAEAGLTGLALAPDFDRSGAVYVLGTFRGPRGLENRVVRLVDSDGRGGDARVVVGGLPADRLHAAGALAFGPDALLYVTVGDALRPAAAQDRGALHGKLLRYRPDGTPAPGNPLGGPIYALGLRNSQGLDWHPAGGLFATDHGPSGMLSERGRSGNDELNLLRPGGNYGWPEAVGERHRRFAAPLAVWDPAIAPSGLAIYTGDDFPAWRGHAFVGALRGRQLRRIGLRETDEGWRATGEEALFRGELGRIRAVTMGPDGALYFTTSNRDGRGSPAPDDDRILRLVPR